MTQTARKREPFVPAVALGSRYDPDRYADALRQVVISHPDDAERNRAERKLQEGTALKYIKDAEEFDARWYVTRQDPLHSFEPRLRQAGLQLRAHKQGLIISTAISGGFSVDYVDGNRSGGMEDTCDRRRTGVYAWERALEAIEPRKRAPHMLGNYHHAFTLCVCGRWPLSEAAHHIGLKPGGKNMDEVKRMIRQGLGAAADYLLGA